MATVVTVEQAKERLEELLADLKPGEEMTVVDESGIPMARVTSLKDEMPVKKLSPEEWMAQWTALAQEIGESWIGDKSALEELSEMRR